MVTTLLVFLISLLIAMFVGVPIAFSLIISGIALLFHMNLFDTQILAATLVDGADNFPLMAIAFFILAGELMNAGGMSKRIIDFAMALVGHVRGGLGYVAIIASIIFSGLSGSAVADTAALGAILIPIMAAAGYNRAKSAALIAASGIIAPILPPSVPMIIFGVTGNVSVPKLFLSGIVPGFLLAVTLALAWAYVIRKEDFKLQPRQSLSQIWRTAKGAVWAFILPVFIVVGLRGGIFTPTEAAAVAAVYAFLVGGVVYRELKPSKINEVLVGSAKTTSVVMFLAAAAMITSWLIAVANIPLGIAALLEPFMDNKIMLMMAINITILIVGTAMDATPTILILTPVLMPLIYKAGIDPVYFGLMFVYNNMIGVLTPPVGTVLNVASGVGKVPMDELIKNIMPYLLAEIALLVFMTIFPEIVTIPVSWMAGGQ